MESGVQAMSDADVKVTELNRAAVRLYKEGSIREALAAATEAVREARARLGEGHPETADGLANLGFLLQKTGDPARARDCCERVLAIRRRTLGEEDPATADS